jgi:hypothetical protein
MCQVKGWAEARAVEKSHHRCTTLAPITNRCPGTQEIRDLVTRAADSEAVQSSPLT